MALPSNVGYGTVTGRFMLAYADSSDVDPQPDGVPAKGYVIFTASPTKLLDASANPAPVTILPAPVIANLNADGYIEGYSGNAGVRLVATNDAQINPLNWTWNVDFRLTDENDVPYPVQGFSFQLPEGQTIDLAVVSPVPSANGTFYLVGPTGATGATGQAGPAPEFTVLPTITSAPGGDAEVVITGTSPDLDIEFTIPRGEQGPQGEEGPQGDPGADALWNFLGTYNSATTYVEGDVVSYLGSSYYHHAGSSTNEPPTNTTYWHLVVAKGDTGPQGPEGPEGPTGPQGSSIVVKGSVATVGNLPSTGNTVNDAYIVTADGHLYVWDGDSWVDAGQIQGPPGEGVPTGGAANTFLKKVSSTDYDTEWSNTIDGGNA